jgi:hypothetical protein
MEKFLPLPLVPSKFGATNAKFLPNPIANKEVQDHRIQEEDWTQTFLSFPQSTK